MSDLENMSSLHQDTRTHVVGELYDTERSYVESLQVLVEKYMKPLKSLESNRVLIDSNLVDEIFYTIPEILQHHETFLRALQDRLSSDWDTSQVIGNVFIEAFTNQQIIDTYTAFINNWKNARQAIKIATQAKPAFERFLEAMSREHRNKLTLDALLIMPVQRIPRYELLIKELIKHTPEDHPDYGPLIEAQKEIHELALKIDRAEREMIHQEQLKDIESLIEGHVELQHPQRDFIRYDLVTILGASALTVAKKERVIFLFCDLLIMTSVKKKASRRSNLQAAFANSSNDLSLLEGNKFKLLLRVPLDQVEVRLSSEQIQIQQQQQEHQHQLQSQQQNKLFQDRKRELEADLHILHQITALSSKMIADDKSKINDTINELSSQLREKLSILEQSDIQAVGGVQQSPHHSVQVTPDLCTIQSSNPPVSCTNNTQNSNFATTPNATSSAANSLASTTMNNQFQQTQSFSVTSPSTILASSLPSGNQQDSNTSLEFLISSGVGGGSNISGAHTIKDSTNAFLSPTSKASESVVSGEQGFAVGNQKLINTIDLQSNHHLSSQTLNCESLVVTFASFDRHQAFLQAFIEAKQQRYQLKQQRQHQRMFSTSTVLRLSGSPDNREDAHQSKSSHHDNADARATGVLTPVHNNKTSPKQQALNNTATRISSAPLHQNTTSGSTIIHQMSAPQSLSLVSASSNDIKISNPSQCNFCSSNLNLENEQTNQQHHHHHRLIHQPNSHPASLDTICCHEHHNDSRKFNSSSGSIKRLSQLNELNAAESSPDKNHYINYYQQMQHKINSNSIVDLNKDTDNSNFAQNTDRQKVHLMNNMKQLLLLKSAPKFIVNLPMNFLNTQHPALHFTCSTLKVNYTEELKHIEFPRREQTVRDNSGQLWLCMSNGYVSHIALISIRKRWVKRSIDALNQEDQDYHGNKKHCYNIVPIIQSAGDICKSQINCATQVRLVKNIAAGRKDPSTCTNEQTLNKKNDSKSSNSDLKVYEDEKTNMEGGLKSISPPVNIKPNTPPGTSDSPKFLSESAPSNSDSSNHVDRPSSTVPSSASTTRLEVPSYFGSIPQLKSLQRSNECVSGKRRSAHGPACQKQYLDNLIYFQNRLDTCTPGSQRVFHSAGHRCNRMFTVDPYRSGHLYHHHHYHHHHHHHHHHSHHHSHLHHSGNNHHSHNHNPSHHVYGSRHHTVPIVELRRALERQNRVTEQPGARIYGHQRQGFCNPDHRRPASDLVKTVTPNQQQIISLDLAERGANSADKKIAGKSFRSARLLRHQASLKTSSILAKLVSGASKRSSYLRKSGQGTDKQHHQPLEVDDFDTDTDSGNPHQHQSTKQEDTSSVDSNILAITTSGANKYLLNTSQPDSDNVISPLSSVSSLASTNSSITVNSVCASSPNRSTCDLLTHSQSTTCCNGVTQQQRPGVEWECTAVRNGPPIDCAHRSRSATVPSRALFQQSLDSESKNPCSLLNCRQGNLSAETCSGGIEDKCYKVSEIIGESHHKEADTLREDIEMDYNVESSLWLGCDDGTLLIISCLNNYRNISDCNYCDLNQKNLNCGDVHSEIKLGSAICDISTYKDRMVFVALSNGQLAIFARNCDSKEDNISESWSLTNPTIITVTTNELNSTSKLCLIDDNYLWYAYGKNIFVLNITALKLETTIMVPTNDPSLQLTMQSITIDNMELMSNSFGVWISFKNSHLIQLYDVKNYTLLTEINLLEPINKMLSYGSEILRQHKTACIKATSLLNINNARERCNTLFIGTSAGIILYLNISHEQLESKQTTEKSLNDLNPQIASLRHGHSGHVKFLHVIEVENDRSCEIEYSTDSNNNQTESISSDSEMFLISGGIGVDLYGPNDEQNSTLQPNSDEDGLNHLILWQL